MVTESHMRPQQKCTLISKVAVPLIFMTLITLLCLSQYNLGFIMDQGLILWVLVRVRILFIQSPGPDFIDVHVAGPDFINGESGPCFYPFYSGF